MDMKGGKAAGVGGGGGTNWAIGIDMYTLMCIKLMTNKNLLYKKKLKIKNKILCADFQLTSFSPVSHSCLPHMPKAELLRVLQNELVHFTSTSTTTGN